MADDDKSQTQGSDDGKSQTAGSEGAGQEETYTKAQLTEIISKEVGKVTAKHAKKIDALQIELEAERRKSLPDPEKVKAEMADRDKQIAEANAKLAAFEAKEKKRAALDAAKLTLPKDVSLTDLLDMMPDNTDEGIASSVARFQKMFPESKGLGTGTQTGQQTKSPDIDEQIKTAHAEALKTGNWNVYNSLTLQKQGLKVG